MLFHSSLTPVGLERKRSRRGRVARRWGWWPGRLGSWWWLRQPSQARVGVSWLVGEHGHGRGESRVRETEKEATVATLGFVARAPLPWSWAVGGRVVPACLKEEGQR